MPKMAFVAVFGGQNNLAWLFAPNRELVARTAPLFRKAPPPTCRSRSLARCLVSTSQGGSKRTPGGNPGPGLRKGQKFPFGTLTRSLFFFAFFAKFLPGDTPAPCIEPCIWLPTLGWPGLCYGGQEQKLKKFQEGQLGKVFFTECVRFKKLPSEVFLTKFVFD